MNLLGGRLIGTGLILAMLAPLAACGTTGAAGPSPDATKATPAADTRIELPCVKSGAGATGPKASDFCWIDWSNLPLRDGTVPVSITVDGGHVDANLTITHTTNSELYVYDYSTGTAAKWSQLIPAYKLKGNTALGFRQTEHVHADRSAKVTLTDITPVADVTGGGANIFTDFRMAFGDAETMSSWKDGAYERTDISSDKPIEPLGWVGDTDPAHSYRTANTGWGTTKVTLAGGSGTFDANGASSSKGAAIAGATEPKTFTVDFQQHNYEAGDSAIAVGLYLPYTVSYPLHYDGNGAQSGTTPQQK